MAGGIEWDEQLTDSTTASSHARADAGESATEDEGNLNAALPLQCQGSTPAVGSRDAPQGPNFAPVSGAGFAFATRGGHGGPSRPLRSRLQAQAAAAERGTTFMKGDDSVFDWDLLGQFENIAAERKPKPKRHETLVEDAMEGLASLALNVAGVAGAMAAVVGGRTAAVLGTGEAGPAMGGNSSPVEQPAPQARQQGSPRMAVLVNGSEGDLRPMLALGKLLQEKGHQVRVFTNVNLVHLCVKHGFDAVPVFADSQAVIQGCGGMRGQTMMEAMTQPARLAKKWLREHEGEYVHVQDALEDFEPEGVLAGSQVLAVCTRYESIKHVPAMAVMLSRFALEDPSYQILVDAEPPRPSFYASSEVVDSHPVPFARVMRTGAWVLKDDPQTQDLAPGGSLYELERFLSKGSPPVALGWGSMLAAGLPPAEMLELGLRALMQTGKRGVVLGGWAELDRVAAVAADGRLPSRFSDGGRLAAFAAEQVFFIPWAPHDWLFPRCCCIIHHGGVGTTHAVLRACRPSVVTPICTDQFANAEAVSMKHVGVGFAKGLPEISAKELARAVGVALESATAAAAQILGRKLLREGHAASRAAEMIDGYIRGKVKLGKDGQWIRTVTKNAHPSRSLLP